LFRIVADCRSCGISQNNTRNVSPSAVPDYQCHGNQINSIRGETTNNWYVYALSLSPTVRGSLELLSVEVTEQPIRALGYQPGCSRHVYPISRRSIRRRQVIKLIRTYLLARPYWHDVSVLNIFSYSRSDRFIVSRYQTGWRMTPYEV